MANFFKINFVNNKYKLLAIILCLFFIGLSFLSNEGSNWGDLKNSGNAITTDELAHIPSGYYYLKTGKYFLNVEHPPLIKDLSALPLLFVDPVLPDISSEIIFPEGYAWEGYPPKEFIYSKNLEIRNAQWDWGRVFLFNSQNNPDLIAFWARLSIVFFNAIFLFLLYGLLAKAWNRRSAVVSLFLIIFSQFSLAHGSLVAMDFMSAVLQLLAIVSFSIYIKNSTEDKRSGILFITTVGLSALALLSKFSSLVIFPSLFIGGFIYLIFIKKKWRDVCRYVLKFSAFSFSILFLIVIYYYFHTFNMDSNDMLAQLNHYYPKELPFGIKGILEVLIFSNPLLRGFAQYISGVLMVFSRMNFVYQEIFFMGKVYGLEGAGSLYFPILYIAKLPVGLLILNLMALSLTIWGVISSKKRLLQKTKLYLKNPTSLFLIIFIFCFAVITLSSNLQIGLRHIMPIILGITVLTAKTIDFYWDRNLLKIKFKYIFSSIFLFIILSVLISFPNYISHYNIFFGGANNGYKIATDSNFDWGQDSKELAKWVKSNNIAKIYVDIEGNIPLQWYIGGAYNELDLKKNINPESGSYVAVAISKYEIRKYNFLEENFVKKIGKTILIYKVP